MWFGVDRLLGVEKHLAQATRCAHRSDLLIDNMARPAGHGLDVLFDPCRSQHGRPVRHFEDVAGPLGDLGCLVMTIGVIGEGIGVRYWCDFRVNPQDVLPKRLERDVDSAEVEETGDVFGRVVSLGRDGSGHAIKDQSVDLGMTGRDGGVYLVGQGLWIPLRGGGFVVCHRI